MQDAVSGKSLRFDAIVGNSDYHIINRSISPQIQAIIYQMIHHPSEEPLKRIFNVDIAGGATIITDRGTTTGYEGSYASSTGCLECRLHR